MSAIPSPDTLERLLARRDSVARNAAAAIAHRHDDAELLETCQLDLEEALEHLLPRRIWRQLYPTWRELDLILVHDPASGEREEGCVLCAGRQLELLTTRPQPPQHLQRTA